MIKKILFCLVIYLIAMLLTASVSWIIGTADKSSSEQPKVREIQRRSDETSNQTNQTVNQTDNKNKTVASSEATVSPFSFQVNIIPAERQVEKKKDVFYTSEPPNAMSIIFAKLEKRKKYFMCLCKMRRYCEGYIRYRIYQSKLSR